MLLRDQLLLCASALENGGASPVTQRLCAKRLERIADEVGRREEIGDDIVAAARDEAHLVRIRTTKPRLRIVR